MRFFCRIALAFLLVYLFEDNVLGAPTKGRYMWVNCKPDGENANCVQNQGPLIDLAGLSQRLPPSAAKDIVPEESSEDTPETETEEQSGESSGDLDPFDSVSGVSKKWVDDGPQVEEPIVDAGSGEIDYLYNASPEQVEPKLSAEDLRQDNMIQ
ncbi:hypothetical protein AOLI_G00019800 [Acnodon oligacanthus]